MGHHRTHQKLQKLRHALRLDKAHPLARKVIVGVVGGVCLVAGIVMIFFPGPAFIFIPLGLLLLASEFKWAEPWARKVLDGLRQVRTKWRVWRRRRARATTAKL
jgi:hypothetical protein